MISPLRGGQLYGKNVYGYEKLMEIDKDEYIIIISNSVRYHSCADKLKKMGFVENEHFFNGWKLHNNFYKKLFNENNWQIEENESRAIFDNKAWEARAKFMASMIPLDATSVMDIGCGDQKLRKYLRPDIKYYGLDYMDRENDTIVCDLNKDEFPHISVDLYYLAGVLCYINDPQKIFKCIGNSVARYVLISLRPTDNFIRLDGHVKCSMNDSPQYISNDDVINCMYNEGFVLVNAQYDYFFQNCHYYLFKRSLSKNIL